MIKLDRQHIRTRLTIYFVSVLEVIVLVYSAAACFFLLRDLRSQVVRHAIQDIETVEGLLYFTPQGRLLLNEDYHNHPESKRVLERLLEVRRCAERENPERRAAPRDAAHALRRDAQIGERHAQPLAEGAVEVITVRGPGRRQSFDHLVGESEQRHGAIKGARKAFVPRTAFGWR